MMLVAAIVSSSDSATCTTYLILVIVSKFGAEVSLRLGLRLSRMKVGTFSLDKAP
jgi:hypothetical protein